MYLSLKIVGFAKMMLSVKNKKFADMKIEMKINSISKGISNKSFVDKIKSFKKL